MLENKMYLVNRTAKIRIIITLRAAIGAQQMRKRPQKRHISHANYEGNKKNICIFIEKNSIEDGKENGEIFSKQERLDFF